MSGINSVASKKVGGNKFFEKYDEFNKKFNFNYYKNSFSNSNNSINSIGSLMNFKNYINTDEKHKFISKSKNYFIEYDLLSNKLFEKFKSISVIQKYSFKFL